MTRTYAPPTILSTAARVEPMSWPGSVYNHRMTLSTAEQETQAKLKAALQGEAPGQLEDLAAALLGDLLGVTVAVAKSGFQHGADAGPSGRRGRRLRVECKRYSDTTSLSDRELLGEVDHALARAPSLAAWILVATLTFPDQSHPHSYTNTNTISVTLL